MRAAQKRTIADTWRHVGSLVATIEPQECSNCPPILPGVTDPVAR